MSQEIRDYQKLIPLSQDVGASHDIPIVRCPTHRRVNLHLFGGCGSHVLRVVGGSDTPPRCHVSNVRSLLLLLPSLAVLLTCHQGLRLRLPLSLLLHLDDSILRKGRTAGCHRSNHM